MKTKCYSVRLKSLTQTTSKCFKAIAFDGSEALIPASQVFGEDYSVQKSEAYWISCWILEQKNLQYSCKKIGWYNPKTNKVEPKIEITIEKHTPQKITILNTIPNAELTR